MTWFPATPNNPYAERKQYSYKFILGIALFLCCILSLKGTSQIHLKGSIPLQKFPPYSLRLMTFNLRFASANDGLNSWNYRKNHLFSIINDYHPIVMGTQEGLKDQLKEIHEHLEHPYERFGIEREPNGEYEQIFYDQEQVKFLNGGNFWMSPNPDIPYQKAWDAPCVRMLTWAHFQLRATTQTFFVFNTQYDHVSELSRNNSALLTWTRIQDITKQYPKDPIFLMGDFNTYRYTWVFKYLTSRQGANLVDAWEQAEKQIGTVSYTYHGWQGVNKPEERGAKVAENHIDWILYGYGSSRPNDMKSKHAEVITAKRKPNNYPSDHYPIFSIIELPEFIPSPVVIDKI